MMHGTMSLKRKKPQFRPDHVGVRYLYRYYDLYRRLWLQFLVLPMMSAVTPETCSDFAEK